MKKIIFKSILIFAIITFTIAFTTSNVDTDHPKRFIDHELNAKHRTHQPNGVDADKFLYIHLIPHSHDDVGWLKTVDQYFYGAKPDIQKASVQYIIDSVIDELTRDSTRKFIQVESAYLYRWWNNNSEQRKNQYRKLVENGQIEFINGGWCMHDEATTYYEDIIDQMTVGHQWLLQQFGEKGIPTIGWHIDPFGHQSTNAAIFSQMGFNAWWFSRIDYQDQNKRLNEQSLEMVWNPFQASGQENSIFTAVNYGVLYTPPENFNFDFRANDDPIMDDPHLEDYNVDTKSDEFVNYFRGMSTHFRTNHLLHTMGDDFNYQNANANFKNIDKLMNYINSRSDHYNVKILYSTPSLYLDEIYKQNITWPTKNDDFFPYADDQNSYWTGYFTSRVALKGNVRESGRYLQHLRNIFTVSKINQSSKYLQQNYQLFLSNLDSYEQNMGILQHHDAVAGTEKQHVAFDYVLRLQNSTDRINEVLHPMMEEFAERDILEQVNYSQCRWNSTANNCTVTYDGLRTGKTVLLNIYNPTIKRSIVMKIKVPNVNFSILNSNNTVVYGESFCVNGTDNTDCDLYFEDEFDSYSYNYYKLVPQTKSGSIKNIIGKSVSFLKETQEIQVSDKVSITINRANTQYILKTCNNNNKSENSNCSENQFEVLYNYYRANANSGQLSGAYIFRPDDKNTNSSDPYSQLKNQYVFNGKIVTIISLEGTQMDTQLRVYANDYYKNVVELETFVKSIPIDDKIGKEVVLIVNTTIQNNKTFYTDSNGLELQKRIFNYRPTWELEVNEPASGNYYPVNGMITIQDVKSGNRISIINDRSQGGTSLKEGQLELMIHRRLLCDDYRGVGEALNELEPTNELIGLQQRLRHYIVFEEDDKNLSRKIQNYIDNLPIVLYAQSSISQFNSVKIPSNFSPLKSNTDPFLKVYFRPMGDNYLLRLNNLNDINTTSFTLPEGFQLIEEVTLTANQNKEQWQKKKYTWKTETEENPKYKEYHKNLNRKLSQSENDQDKIQVKPLELRAFIISYNRTPQFSQE